MSGAAPAHPEKIVIANQWQARLGRARAALGDGSPGFMGISRTEPVLRAGSRPKAISCRTQK
jgi:hypothetical protein